MKHSGCRGGSVAPVVFTVLSHGKEVIRVREFPVCSFLPEQGVEPASVLGSWDTEINAPGTRLWRNSEGWHWACQAVRMPSAQKMKVKGAQSCLTVCDPTDCEVHGILQARILEWVAFPFSKPFPSQPRIEPRSPALQADSLCAEPQGKTKNTGVGSSENAPRGTAAEPIGCERLSSPLEAPSGF